MRQAEKAQAPIVTDSTEGMEDTSIYLSRPSHSFASACRPGGWSHNEWVRNSQIDEFHAAMLSFIPHRIPFARSRRKARVAALYPHMPCTLPPGGVDEEHR